MTWLSLGSLALPHQLQRQGVSLRAEMSRLGVELTTGQSSNPQKKLRGDVGPLAAIEARLSRIDAYEQNARVVVGRVNTTQTTMSKLDSSRSQIMSSMLAASMVGGAADSLVNAGASAKAALQDAISALSVRVAGQAVFSGVATDRDPLVDAETMLAAVVPLVNGFNSAQDVATTVNSAFTDPGGLFETAFYQGVGSAPEAMIDDGSPELALPTAADPAVRELLAGLVTAALVAEPSMSLQQGQRRQLAQSSAEALLGNAGAMTGVQARIGDAQARLDTQLLQFSTERDALTLSRGALVGVDPYEAATRLEEARTQLETLYTVTARTSRLSLTGYLR